MKKYITIMSVILTSIFFSACASHAVSAPELRSSETLYKNPDPNIEALHVRAYNYDLGIGVKQNRVLANKLYLQAARAGDPRSMMNYAINRWSGVGIAANRADAYYWIDKARFATQHSKDMKVKWRIRAVYDQMREEMASAQKK